MRTTTVNTPSMLTFEIREATGADDQILTAADGNDGEVIDKWMQRLIQKGPKGVPMTIAELRDIPVRDKYVLLLKMRIFSLSENLIFPFEFQAGFPKEFNINLNVFVWDYTKPLPTIEDDDYAAERILPYAKPPEELVLTVGDRTVRFDYLDGHGEVMLLDLAPADRNLNSVLIARKLRLVAEGADEPIRNFSSFSVRDMMEIRNFVETHDPEVNGNVKIQDERSLEVAEVSILQFKEFFYPAKI